MVAPKKSEPPPGLGEALFRNLGPSDHRPEEPFLLVLGSESVQGFAHDRGHDKSASQGHPQDSDLFFGHYLGGPGELPSAVLSGEPQSPQALPGQLGDEFVGKLGLIPVHGPQKIGRHFIPDKLPHFIPQSSFLIGQQSIVEHESLLPGFPLPVSAGSGDEAGRAGWGSPFPALGEF